MQVCRPCEGKHQLIVSEKRGMPWRKPYDDSLSMEEKGQRAYEVSCRLMYA